LSLGKSWRRKDLQSRLRRVKGVTNTFHKDRVPQNQYPWKLLKINQYIQYDPAFMGRYTKHHGWLVDNSWSPQWWTSLMISPRWLLLLPSWFKYVYIILYPCNVIIIYNIYMYIYMPYKSKAIF
jgi:hypothetical protein